jgi:hypothetical protein
VKWVISPNATSSSDNLQKHYSALDTINENKVLDFVQREQTPEFGIGELAISSQKMDCNEIELGMETTDWVGGKAQYSRFSTHSGDQVQNYFSKRSLEFPRVTEFH